MKATATRTRIELRNVLYATDFSDAALAAMPYAKEIAKRYGAQLAVLHVRPPVVNPATPPETWASAEEAAGIQDEIRSKELGKEFAEFHADILLPEGDVQTLLPNLVEQKN